MVLELLHGQKDILIKEIGMMIKKMEKDYFYGR